MTASGPKAGQKWNPFKSLSLLQNSSFGSQWQLQVCPIYMCCLQPKLRAKYNQESILSLFLLMIWIWPVILEKLQKEDFMKTCWIWLCCRMEHQLIRPQKLKIGCETIFLNSKSKTNAPKHAWPFAHRKSGGIFKSRAEMSKPYSRNLEYLQATVKDCQTRATFPWNKIYPTLLDV